MRNTEVRQLKQDKSIKRNKADTIERGDCILVQEKDFGTIIKARMIDNSNEERSFYFKME